MNRINIGFFGKTNVGKSSFLNKITSQDISIVSDIAGTTTDVVEKIMEFLPIGPVKFFDTAGIDDVTELSQQRINKAIDVVKRIDIGILLCDYNGLNSNDKIIIDEFSKLKIPFLIVVNKTDIQKPSENTLKEIKSINKNVFITSTKTDKNIVENFKKNLLEIIPNEIIKTPKIIGDLIKPNSVVIMVVPIDKAAPKGRLILPQVQTLRDLLDSNCLTMVVKETELTEALNALKKPPSLVVTDSQVFQKVSEIVPDEIYLTSFSILFARLKGDLEEFINGAHTIDNLKDGDKILILESCSHHATDDDIGTVKIPQLVRNKTGKNLVFEKYSGHDFPDIDKYKLIIHCGACMTNRKEVLSRILIAKSKGIPITNYGLTISYCLGIFPRALKIFNQNL